LAARAAYEEGMKVSNKDAGLLLEEPFKSMLPKLRQYELEASTAKAGKSKYAASAHPRYTPMCMLVVTLSCPQDVRASAGSAGRQRWQKAPG
jgi:hypothetical protein